MSQYDLKEGVIFFGTHPKATDKLYKIVIEYGRYYAKSIKTDKLFDIPPVSKKVIDITPLDITEQEAKLIMAL